LWGVNYYMLVKYNDARSSVGSVRARVSSLTTRGSVCLLGTKSPSRESTSETRVAL